MDDNSFANLVGKLNQIDAGRKPHERQFKPKENHIKEGMKNNNMTSILENLYRDVPFESAKTVSTKEFQKGYKPKQLPADYKMPNVSPVLGGDEEKIPTKGYMVGDSIDPDLIAQMARDADEVDIEDVGEYDQEGKHSKGQLNRAADAALELQSILDDDENLPEWVQDKITKALDYLDTSRDYMKNELEEAPLAGTQDIKDYQQTGTPGQPNNVPDQKGAGNLGSTDGVSKDTDMELSGPINKANKAKQVPEDSIGDKKSIMDYLGDIEKKHNSDMINTPIKSFTTDGGKELKIHGNEDDGYRIKVNGKESKSSFGKLDDAVVACETFLERAIQNNTDYVDER
mgnify:CR=1 FL=1